MGFIFFWQPPAAFQKKKAEGFGPDKEMRPAAALAC